MYSCTLFSGLVVLAISFSGRIEGVPSGPTNLYDKEPEKQPLLQAESISSASALPKMLQEEAEKQLIQDESMANAPTALPKMVEEELEQQPEIETGSSNGQESKEKGIRGAKHSLVHIPKIERSEIQEEGNTEDEKSEIKRMISRSSTFSRRQSQKYTDDQLKDWKDAFEIYDIDKNGEISAEELEQTLRRLDLFEGPKEKIKLMIKGFDRDNSGTIDFQEFIAMMSDRSVDELGELQRLFNRFDKNGDGFISADELKSFDLIGNDTRTDLVIAEVDTNGDGLLDFIEFQALLTRIGYYGPLPDNAEE